jgi:hypothetical protein
VMSNVVVSAAMAVTTGRSLNTRGMTASPMMAVDPCVANPDGSGASLPHVGADGQSERVRWSHEWLIVPAGLDTKSTPNLQLPTHKASR